MMNFGSRTVQRSGPSSANWRKSTAGTPSAPRMGGTPSTFRPGALDAIEEQPQASATGSAAYVPPHMKQGAKVTPSTMNQVTQQMGSFTIGTHQKIYSWNASNAPAPAKPAPSMLTCHFGAPGQANSVNTIAANDYNKNKWVKTAICVKSPFTRITFNKGDVISLPYHVSNMNPNLTIGAPGLLQGEHGPVLSKRRMVIVLFKLKEVMFCVPFYSFTGRGIQSRRAEVLDQYIQLINVSDDETKFEGNGKYKPVKLLHAHADKGGRLDACTAVHITGGKTMSWSEDIELVGRLNKQSYTRLVGLWRGFNEEAEKEACSWPA